MGTTLIIFLWRECYWNILQLSVILRNGGDSLLLLIYVLEIWLKKLSLFLGWGTVHDTYIHCKNLLNRGQKSLIPFLLKKTSLKPVFNKSLEHFKKGSKAGFSLWAWFPEMYPKLLWQCSGNTGWHTDACIFYNV